MGTVAECGVLALCPRQQVVGDRLTRTGVVRGLIPDEPGVHSEVAGDRIGICLPIRIGCRSPVANGPRQRGSAFDREGVRGEMADPGIESSPHRTLPRGERLTRGSINEVDAHPTHGRERCLDRAPRVVRRVDPSERPEDVVVEGLHAEGDPPEPDVAQRPSHIDRQILGVPLDRHLDIRGDAEPIADRLEDAAEIGGIERRRCPAPKRDRIEGTIERLGPFDLADDRSDVPIREVRALDHGEVAVWTDPVAEGDVDVGADEFGGRIGQSRTVRLVSPHRPGALR
jgi:hypothetical protein